MGNSKFLKTTLQEEISTEAYFFLPEFEDDQSKWIPGGISFVGNEISFSIFKTLDNESFDFLVLKSYEKVLCFTSQGEYLTLFDVFQTNRQSNSNGFPIVKFRANTLVASNKKYITDIYNEKFPVCNFSMLGLNSWVKKNYIQSKGNAIEVN